MSGICGICEPGRTLSPAGIEAMLAAFVLPEESAQQAPGADSVSLAVASRWYFQQVADIPGVRIAADAELLNRAELTNHLKSGNFDAARLTSAELLARLYREHGVSFVELLDGVFSFAIWDEENRRLMLAMIASGSTVCIGARKEIASFLLRGGSHSQRPGSARGCQSGCAGAVHAIQRRPRADGDLSWHREASPWILPHL